MDRVWGKLKPSNAVPVTTLGGLYAPELMALRGRRVSGVYAIVRRGSGRVLYIGESHTGRLYDTITRHFRKWRRPKRTRGAQPRGGVTYNRAVVSFVVEVTTDQDAQAVQFACIQAFSPRDNEVDGGSVAVEIPV